MPIVFKQVSEEEAKEIFARKERASDNVDDYVELLKAQRIDIGKSFKLQTEGNEPTSLLAGSKDEDDPDGVTVRAAKRRFNGAAKMLNFELRWRHSDNWLVAKVVASTPKVVANGAAH